MVSTKFTFLFHLWFFSSKAFLLTLSALGFPSPCYLKGYVCLFNCNKCFFLLLLVQCLKCKNNSNTFDPLMDIMLDVKVRAHFSILIIVQNASVLSFRLQYIWLTSISLFCSMYHLLRKLISISLFCSMYHLLRKLFSVLSNKNCWMEKIYTCVQG